MSESVIASRLGKSDIVDACRVAGVAVDVRALVLTVLAFVSRATSGRVCLMSATIFFTPRPGDSARTSPTAVARPSTDGASMSAVSAAAASATVAASGSSLASSASSSRWSSGCGRRLRCRFVGVAVVLEWRPHLT